MPIDLRCTGCTKLLRVSDDARGKRARCPSCGEIVSIPKEADPEKAPSLETTSDNPFQNRPFPGGVPQAQPFQGQPTAIPASANPYLAPSAPHDWFSQRRYRMLASRGTRFVGALLDGLIVLVAVIPGAVLLGIGIASDEEVAGIFGMLLIVAGCLIVTIINWVMIAGRGQTIAKRMLGMRIVGYTDGELPGFVRGVIMRIWVVALINQACGLFALIDVLWIFGEERRCLHDLIADTTVIDVQFEDHQSPSIQYR